MVSIKNKRMLLLMEIKVWSSSKSKPKSKFFAFVCWGRQLSDLLDCLTFRMAFLWDLWFVICLKWRIKPWGWFPIFVLSIWELSEFSPNIDRRGPYSLPKDFKKSRK